MTMCIPERHLLGANLTNTVPIVSGDHHSHSEVSIAEVK
jgi:hypothetical protein